MSARPHWWVWAVAVVLVLTMVAGLLVGALPVRAAAVLAALGGHRDALTRAIVLDARLPRVLAAVLVGAGLGTAGAVMQALTRNPLASPGLMGLNGGAAALLAITLVCCPTLGLGALSVVAALGAGLGAGTVWLIAASIPLGFTPQRLALVGAVVAGLLGALAAAVVVANGMQNDLLYWMVGGLGTVGWREVAQLLPCAAFGLVVVWFLAPALAVAALGDEAATGLGLRVRRTRILATLAVLALAGGANAAAGPVGFVGLMAPHIGRALIGGDERRLIPVAAAIGAILVVLADALGRWIAPPTEQPLGVFMALLGGPFLIVLARRRAVVGT